MYVTYSPIVNDNILLNKFETEMLFFLCNLSHWLHQKLSKWQPLVRQKFHQNISVSVYVDVYSVLEGHHL